MAKKRTPIQKSGPKEEVKQLQTMFAQYIPEEIAGSLASLLVQNAVDAQSKQTNTKEAKPFHVALMSNKEN